MTTMLPFFPPPPFSFSLSPVLKWSLFKRAHTRVIRSKSRRKKALFLSVEGKNWGQISKIAGKSRFSQKLLFFSFLPLGGESFEAGVQALDCPAMAATYSSGKWSYSFCQLSTDNACSSDSDSSVPSGLPGKGKRPGSIWRKRKKIVFHRLKKMSSTKNMRARTTSIMLCFLCSGIYNVLRSPALCQYYNFVSTIFFWALKKMSFISKTTLVMVGTLGQAT